MGGNNNSRVPRVEEGESKGRTGEEEEETPPDPEKWREPLLAAPAEFEQQISGGGRPGNYPNAEVELGGDDLLIIRPPPPPPAAIQEEEEVINREDEIEESQGQGGEESELVVQEALLGVVLRSLLGRLARPAPPKEPDRGEGEQQPHVTQNREAM